MVTSIERTLSILGGHLYLERISSDPSLPHALQEQTAFVAANLPSAEALDKHVLSRAPRISVEWDFSFRAALSLLLMISAGPSFSARARYLARRLLRWFPDESMIRELSDPDSYLMFGPLLERLDEKEMSRLKDLS